MTEKSRSGFLSVHVDMSRVLTSVVAAAIIGAASLILDAQRREISDFKDTVHREIDSLRADVHELRAQRRVQ